MLLRWQRVDLRLRRGHVACLVRLAVDRACFSPNRLPKILSNHEREEKKEREIMRLGLRKIMEKEKGEERVIYWIGCGCCLDKGAEGVVGGSFCEWNGN